jgi:hypothetical protein
MTVVPIDDAFWAKADRVDLAGRSEIGLARSVCHDRAAHCDSYSIPARICFGIALGGGPLLIPSGDYERLLHALK